MDLHIIESQIQAFFSDFKQQNQAQQSQKQSLLEEMIIHFKI